MRGPERIFRSDSDFFRNNSVANKIVKYQPVVLYNVIPSFKDMP